MELVKEIFTDIFLKQEQKILGIILIGTADTNSRRDRLIQAIKDNSTRLDVLRKKLDELKLSIEASQQMIENKIEKSESKVKSLKLQQDEYIRELQQKNELLSGQTRAPESRCVRQIKAQ